MIGSVRFGLRPGTFATQTMHALTIAAFRPQRYRRSTSSFGRHDTSERKRASWPRSHEAQCGMDNLDRAQRSALMAKIRSKDTMPEMAVRRIAHGLGFRFRLHRRDLPGSPDLVFAAHHAVVFVHGCFWHRHEGC